MKHRPRIEAQDDLLRPRLVDLIDPRHVLVKLTDMIDGEVFEREWSGFIPSHLGRPATPLRPGADWREDVEWLLTQTIRLGRPLGD